MKTVRYTADTRDIKKRIDLFLAERTTFLTRSHIKRLIDSDLVTVNREPVKASFRLRGGDMIELTVPPPRELAVTPEPIPLDVLFEDESIVVINKPAGMVVHPAAGNHRGTVVNALLSHCPFLSGIGGVQRPGIVHRLDKGTSGLMVIAKSDAAHHHLSRQFKNHEVTKRYQAAVCGRMRQEQGSVSLEIGRHRSDRKKMSVHSRKGRAAMTAWKVVEQFDECSLLEIGITTGRTHQIRVHLAAIHHPIIGDSVYGGKKCIFRIKNDAVRNAMSRLNRPFLHACLLRFVHPRTGKEVLYTQPLPHELNELITVLRSEQCW